MTKQEGAKREDLLYAGEILKNEGITLEDKTLLLSPVGSGKTTLIKEISEQHGGQKLLLVSTSTLKEHVSTDDEIFTVKQQNARRKELGIKGTEDLIVMTYAELGERIIFKRKEGCSVAFWCETLHSAPICFPCLGLGQPASFSLSPSQRTWPHHQENVPSNQRTHLWFL